WRDPVPRAPNLDRLGRTLLVDFSEAYTGIYRDCLRLPQGTAVVLGGAGWREIWRYDLLSRPQVRLKRAADYVEAARELLDAGVAATLDGATRPGVLLSSGLDSPTVAASALRRLNGAGEVFGFTYGPEADWPEVAPAPGKYVSEFPGVAAFARMHPALRLETFANRGRDFRFRQTELIRAMDCGNPSVGLCWPHHAIHERARDLGCDVLLTPNWGNETFSSNAPWALPEWFARGHWLRLLEALRTDPVDRRPLWRRGLALAVMPWLPARQWRWVQRLWHGAWPDPFAASGLSRGWAAEHGVLGAIRAAGREPGRFHYPTRRAFWRAIMAEDGQDREQYSQGMEILYGVPLRDPAAYRPLVEFCFGIPTEIFRRHGQTRWLAREMGRGNLPEALRCRVETGAHHPDWHARLTPVAAELRDELERMRCDPDVAAVLDLPRLEQLVADLPGLDPADHDARVPYLTALPIGIAAARFIGYAKGRNDI
ncbi:MAG: asparagine synthase-related protein, partial [Novosphingobium sp.]